MLKMLKVHNIKTVERERFITMNTTEKKAIVDNILELLIQLTEDGENTVPQTTKAPTANKVEMLTIKESAALITGLSEHTVCQLVKQGKVKSVRHDVIIRIDRKRRIIDLFVQEFLADHIPIDKECGL